MFNSFTRSEFISLIYLVVHITSVATTNNVVDTKQGKVKGVRQEVEVDNKQKKNVYKFLGVPYAQKPIGDLRFKPPQALSARRSSDYDATSLRPICTQPQYYFDSIKGAWPEFDETKDMSEDCLYLNIYTPSIKSCKKKYPVIFYIHGGSYVAGTPTRDISPGEYLPTRGVVLVTIQYRLGTFGFFTTGDSEAPGNVGLLDQVEALKWVQQNIEGFCGDKNSVTLLGESAGGSSVSLHYLSPLSRGLFHRGIAVSGVDLSPFAYKPKSTVLKASETLISKLNCERNNSKATLQCLQSSSISDIRKNAPSPFLMQPFVDKHFLPDEPQQLRTEGKFRKLPLMSGFVSQEGAMLLESKKKEEYNTEGFRKYLEDFLKMSFQRTKDKALTAFNALEFQFTPWGFLSNGPKHRRKLVEMLSDFYVAAPTHAALTYHSDYGAPTYMFEFAHRSKLHPKPKWMGVIHEDTTPYKFGLPLLNSKTRLKFDEKDKKVSDTLVTMFTNFAKFGKPIPTPVKIIKWLKFKSFRTSYMKVKEKPFLTSRYYPLRMAFWNKYFPTLLPDKEDSVLGDEVADLSGTANFDQMW
ncbi:cholinesterase 1-like [Actinia tenebrosa]|uniref:Cholinesterase 1-like n=1 Tax=Actinia tenebrosa TaxID=6105 RepID=A0A6P8HWQ3_ACTTE|nr:cholinesterase 1-like [Actinia tenebrosa]